MKTEIQTTAFIVALIINAIAAGVQFYIAFIIT